MFDFIIQLLIVGSLGTIIVILGRALPRVEESSAGERGKEGVVDRLLRRIPMSEIDTAIAGFLEKALRKIRVVNLKIENLVNDGIQRLRGPQQHKKQQDDANDLFEKK